MVELKIVHYGKHLYSKICGSCGRTFTSNIPSDARFCPYCGKYFDKINVVKKEATK